MHKRLSRTFFCCKFPGERMLRCWKKKKRARLQFKGRDYLGSVHLTWRHFTREHNGCCEVACPLSIVRFSQPHPVSPRSTSPPLLLEKTPSREAEDLQLQTSHSRDPRVASARVARAPRLDTPFKQERKQKMEWSVSGNTASENRTFPIVRVFFFFTHITQIKIWLDVWVCRQKATTWVHRWVFPDRILRTTAFLCMFHVLAGIHRSPCFL